MAVYRFSHPTLGPVIATGRSGSTKLSARWVNGTLHLNVPAAAGQTDVLRVIEKHLANFEAIRPEPRYKIGQTIDCHNYSIHIAEGSLSQAEPNIFLASKDLSRPEFVIAIPPDIPVGSQRIQQAIARGIHLSARRLAPQILIPRARDISYRLGLRVDKWEIASGKNTLGCCFPRQRRIRLSYMCVFLDQELRDYIIYHELAHLTEPGHTETFHRLCDSYCSGREKDLIRRLHKFPWPVDR